MRASWTWLTRDWTLKLAALGVALLLWAVVRAEDVVTATIPFVRVEASIRDPGWELAVPPAPARVRLQVTGPARELLHLELDHPQVVVPVEEVRDSVLVLVLRDAWVHFPLGVTRTRVDDVRPATVRLVFDAVAARSLAVALPLRGRLPAGLELTGPIVLEPGRVRASGPRGRLLHVDSIRLPALDLSHLTDTTSFTVDIDTARLGLAVEPASVHVRVPVGHALAAPAGAATTPGLPGAGGDTLHPDSAPRAGPAAER